MGSCNIVYHEHKIHLVVFFGGGGAIAPGGPSSFTRFVFLDHTQRHTTVGGTPLDE